MSATPDFFGTSNACPECHSPVTVPVPPGCNANAAELAKLVRSVGYEFTAPPDLDAEDLERALDEFLTAQGDGFGDALRAMAADEIIHWRNRPTREQLCQIGNQMLAQMLAGTWGGTELDTRALILKIAPGIRAK